MMEESFQRLAEVEVNAQQFFQDIGQNFNQDNSTDSTIRISMTDHDLVAEIEKGIEDIKLNVENALSTSDSSRKRRNRRKKSRK